MPLRSHVVLCAVLVAIVVGPVAMLFLALSAHGKVTDRPVEQVQPVLVRSL